MKIQIIDGEVTEVSSEDWQAFEAWRKEQAKGWPQKHDSYWWLDADGDIFQSCWTIHTVDTDRQRVGNIYRTEAEALAQVEKLKAKARIDKYIAENGLMFVPDWRELGQRKYYIFYDHSTYAFDVSSVSREQELLAVAYHLPIPFRAKYLTSLVFSSEAHAQQVIDNCTDDLKTIFGVK